MRNRFGGRFERAHGGLDEICPVSTEDEMSLRSEDSSGTKSSSEMLSRIIPDRFRLVAAQR